MSNARSTPDRQMTWADVKHNPGLEEMSLSIHACGAVTKKRWVRAAVPDWHWDRIATIAETPPAGEPLGYSWVESVVINGQSLPLARPAHLTGDPLDIPEWV